MKPELGFKKESVCPLTCFNFPFRNIVAGTLAGRDDHGRLGKHQRERQILTENVQIDAHKLLGTNIMFPPVMTQHFKIRFFDVRSFEDNHDNITRNCSVLGSYSSCVISIKDLF